MYLVTAMGSKRSGFDLLIELKCFHAMDSLSTGYESKWNYILENIDDIRRE